MASLANAKNLTPSPSPIHIFVKIKGHNISRYLFDSFQNHVTLTSPLSEKLVNLTKFG